MLFNSAEFIIFFVVLYGLYVMLPHRPQNLLLLAGSYIFYAAWDWRFLSLILISTVIDYYCAHAIDRSDMPRRKKAFLTVSMVSNLGLLGIFKYSNFFVHSMISLLGRFGLEVQPLTLNIILPMGISFYTFQTMSYTIDVYRGQLKPAVNILDFALYVTLFPQLVAGPIERASNLFPQVIRPRKISRYGITHGAYLIFWGYFQKVFIADNIAPLVEKLFEGSAPYNGVHVLLGLYAFALQIYCDFAGYSNIARGLAFCMGFRFMLNFNLPYFATNPSDFWARWHISLSTWLRDYLYIPLGGNRKGTWFTYRNLALTMILGGLWHGAAWNFVLWGIYQGILLIGHRWYRAVRPFVAPAVPWKAAALRVLHTVAFFHLVCLGWLLFRAESLHQIGAMLSALFTCFVWPSQLVLEHLVAAILFFGGLMMVIEWFQFRSSDLYVVLKWPLPVRVAVYLLMFYGLVIFGVQDAQSFIYFQF
ncbi:MAG TPA: MBOAT family O-acyltransferase [Kiritimatiellia bacterium]|nr:MBOAT family O-acyltransferase [Kiritimatiellia bacterium]HQQ03584.1 MBOAT family O-acyltransferase [Kiritimatiellia bacterium]